MLESLQNFTESLPVAVQWLGIIGLGAIPFVESYFGSVIGVLAGLSVFIAVPAAIVGNLVSTFAFIYSADSLRNKVTEGRPDAELSPRRQKLKRAFDRYGVAGVSLLGPTVLASQITAAGLISFGAPRNSVVLWQTVSIAVWGIAFGALAVAGVDLLAN